VKNGLTGSRILAQQTDALAAAVCGARCGTEIAQNEYQAGTVDYTTIVTALTTQLNELSAFNMQQRLLGEARRG
jgi:outer membrane protein TolC